ncbi:MAG: DUF2914 domain-containing protein [Deferribacteraceae bacterium]|jgi:hypothetical protein|nr:DUF2914 domain-containing protein [Deferribacteraceae bacterium]
MRTVILALLFMFVSVCAFAADAEVSRHTFTSAVVDREPVDSLKTLAVSEEGAVFYFSELRNLENTTVAHQWKKNSDVVYEINFDVKGPRWRVFSSMKSGHFVSGDIITVDVVDTDGTVLTSDTLNVK